MNHNFNFVSKRRDSSFKTKLFFYLLLRELCFLKVLTFYRSLKENENALVIHIVQLGVRVFPLKFFEVNLLSSSFAASLLSKATFNQEPKGLQ
jgi:hypothetical protein